MEEHNFDLNLISEEIKQSAKKHLEKQAAQQDQSSKIDSIFNFLTDLANLLIPALKNLLTKPLLTLKKILQREMKIYVGIAMIFPVLFVIFLVSWFIFAAFLTFAAHEYGLQMSESLLFSLIMQIFIAFVLLVLGYVLYRKSLIKQFVDWYKSKVK